MGVDCTSTKRAVGAHVHHSPGGHSRLLLRYQILWGYSVQSWHLAKLPDAASERRLVGAFVAAVLLAAAVALWWW